jgi:hypothetical protein
MTGFPGALRALRGVWGAGGPPDIQFLLNIREYVYVHIVNIREFPTVWIFIFLT